MLSQTVQNDVAGRPPKLEEAALDWLNNAAKAEPIDDNLLSAEGASAIHKAIREALKVVSEIQLHQLLGKQGWLAKLTGADLEARLRFELAAEQVKIALGNLDRAANRSKKLLDLMVKERQRIVSDQQRIEEAISYADHLAQNPLPDDEFLVDRFQRRAASLKAIHLANLMAMEQFRLAEQGLNSLLDRYTDIAAVVIPLWQQNLFAILHSQRVLKREDREVDGFLVCNSALEEYFSGELS